MLSLQDLAFFLVLGFFVWRRQPKWTVWAGLVFLILSIPLFKFWILFTAQRLIWYSAGLFLLAIIQQKYAYRH